MKKIIYLLITGFVLMCSALFISQRAFAQFEDNSVTQCDLEIQGISGPDEPVTRYVGSNTFECKVRTNKQYTPNLKCDIAIDGKEVEEMPGMSGGACPSSGQRAVLWNDDGTEVTFTCFLPNEIDIPEGATIELTARQNRGRNGCGSEAPQRAINLPVADSAYGEGKTGGNYNYEQARQTVIEEVFAALNVLFSPSDDNPTNTRTRTVPQSPGTGAGDLVHYYQCNRIYNTSNASMCRSGCAPTSVTVALRYVLTPAVAARFEERFGLNLKNPKTMHDYFVQQGWKVNYGGSTWGWKQWLVGEGFSTIHIDLVSIEPGTGRASFNIPRAQQFIKNGCLLIGSSSAHVFVIKSVSDDGMVEIIDSATPYSSTDQGIIRHHWSSGGRNGWTNVTFYAHPICPKNVQDI